MLISARRWGGGTLSYARAAVGLAQRGHAVLLLARGPELAVRFRGEGVAAVGARRALAAWRRLRRFAPDAVVADQPRDLRIGTLPGLGRPGVVYRYNRTEAQPRSGTADRMIARRIASCLFQSEYAYRKAAADEPWLLGRPHMLVPNGFDTARFDVNPSAGRAFRERHGIAANAPLVLTVGELTWDKGFGDAITALGQVSRAFPGLVYLVAGSGPIESDLRRRAEAERMQLLLAGWLEGGDLVAAMNAADLVLHPSRHEIFPNAVGEAMACGRPVIATEVGGTPELVGRGGSGLLVPASDPATLCSVVASLLRAPERAAGIGVAARRRILTEFPLARMVQGIELALRRATGEGRRRSARAVV